MLFRFNNDIMLLLLIWYALRALWRRTFDIGLICQRTYMASQTVCTPLMYVMFMLCFIHFGKTWYFFIIWDKCWLKYSVPVPVNQTWMINVIIWSIPVCWYNVTPLCNKRPCVGEKFKPVSHVYNSKIALRLYMGISWTLVHSRHVCFGCAVFNEYSIIRQ